VLCAVNISVVENFVVVAAAAAAGTWMMIL